MDLEELIQRIKAKPGMFVRIIDLDHISCFVSGFLFNSIMNDRADDMESAFNGKFHAWARHALERKYNIKFDVDRGYVFYIEQLETSPNRRLELFFDLCEEFFNELRKKGCN